MKAFEKWLEKQPLVRVSLVSCIALEEEGMRKGWRAALEWVLSRVQYANSDGSIIQDVNKELED